MTAASAAPKLTMLGSPDALACEGDACLVPETELPVETAARRMKPKDSRPIPGG
jgi:hypothetical protein